MAGYFVNASGSQTAPYDTAAKGATSFTALSGLVTLASGDTIDVVAGSEIVESSSVTLPGVTVRSWVGNGRSRPVIQGLGGASNSVSFNLQPGSSFVDCEVYKDGVGYTGDGGAVFALVGTPPLGVFTTISRNIIHAVNYGVGAAVAAVRNQNTFTIGQGTNLYMKDNLIYGVSDGVSYISSYVLFDLYVDNNIFFNDSTGWSTSRGIHITNTASDSTFVNNIIAGFDYGVSSTVSTIPVGLQVDYNNIYNTTTDYSGYFSLIPHSNDVLADPLFVGQGNFRLQNDSSCIDAGIGPALDASGSTLSLTGVPRSGNTTDIGAYQKGKSNQFSSGTAQLNQIISSSVNRPSVVDMVQAASSDDYFDSTDEIASVAVTYTHEEGRQRKTILHSGAGLTRDVSWSEFSRDGTWEKTRVIVSGHEGAQNTLLRSDFGSNQDVYISDGTVTLNV